MSKTTEQLSWYDIHRGIEHLQQSLEDANFKPDVIITVGRGGLIPGALLTYKVDVKIVHNFSVQTYNDADVKTGFIISIQEPGHSLSLQHKNSKVLIVDDISDTGHTLEYIKNELKTNYGLTNIKFATLFTKKSTTFVPDFFVKQYPDESWIVFPWE